MNLNDVPDMCKRIRNQPTLDDVPDMFKPDEVKRERFWVPDVPKVRPEEQSAFIRLALNKKIGEAKRKERTWGLGFLRHLRELTR
jgi:hypothetical protein